MEKYNLNLVKGTITITSAFAKKMNDTNSSEYKMLFKLKNDFPHLQVIARSHATPKKYSNSDGSITRRNQFKNLTFENMEAFIKALPNSEDLIPEYMFLKETASALQLVPYPIVRKWFAKQFPEYRANPLSYIKNPCVVIKAKEYLPLLANN